MRFLGVCAAATVKAKNNISELPLANVLLTVWWTIEATVLIQLMKQSSLRLRIDCYKSVVNLWLYKDPVNYTSQTIRLFEAQVDIAISPRRVHCRLLPRHSSDRA
jgi:hypothetical protein